MPIPLQAFGINQRKKQELFALVELSVGQETNDDYEF